MVSFFMVCWLLSGILGISIAANIIRAEQDSMSGGYVWFSLLGPVLLFIVLHECVRKATKRS